MLIRWLRRLLCWRPNLGLSLVVGPFTDKEDIMVELDALQQFRLRVAGGRDRKGNPAALEGIVITSTDPSVLDVSPLTDDTGAEVPGGALCKALAQGACDVKIEADARIGDGVVPITKLLPVSVKAPEAVDVDLEIGELENQPD